MSAGESLPKNQATIYHSNTEFMALWATPDAERAVLFFHEGRMKVME